MSSFARAGAAASFIRRCSGHCFRCGISSSSFSRSLLWRRTITSNSISGENPNIHHHHHQQFPNPNTNSKQAPWLLLSSPTNPQSRYLCDLAIGVRDRDDDDPEGAREKIEYYDMELNRELHLPEIAGRIFIGSSEGFLISIDKYADTIHAFNPLTGSHLPIPHLPPPLSRHNSPNMFLRRHIESVHVDNTFLELCQTKAILSPSLDTIIILAGPHGCHGPFFAPLPFSSSSSLMWTMLDYDEHLYEGIFHKGLLHATNNEGALYIFDLKCNKLAAESFSMEPYIRSSLVESPDGDDLFLVHRSIDDDTWCDPYPCHLISVFKLRFNQKKKTYEWDKVKSIGDLAFFVGTKSSSLSLDVSDRHLFPSLKPNSVYFSDTWSVEKHDLDPKMIGEAGVCTLEDKIFHYIELNDGAQLQLNWPPPVWYTTST